MVKVVAVPLSFSAAKVMFASGAESASSSRVGPGWLGEMPMVPSIPVSLAVGDCPAEMEQAIKEAIKIISRALSEVIEFFIGRGIGLVGARVHQICSKKLRYLKDDVLSIRSAVTAAFVSNLRAAATLKSSQLLRGADADFSLDSDNGF